MVLVICLEGCHGCGKTELCTYFENRGVRTLDEGYLDMPEYALHPQTLLMETTWVCSWFERLLKMSQPLQNTGRDEVFIADRSPFSAVFYADHGSLLEPLIRIQLEELRKAANIDIITVHIDVDNDILWERIQERLKSEPQRLALKENDRAWMEKSCAFYRNFKWDMTIENNGNITETGEKIIEDLQNMSCKFRNMVKRNLSFCSMEAPTDEDDLTDVLSSCDESTITCIQEDEEDDVPLHHQESFILSY